MKMYSDSDPPKDILLITECDQEPMFKIYWSCLLLSKHYADKEGDVCEVWA